MPTHDPYLVDDSIRCILREILPADWDLHIQQGMWLFAAPPGHSLEPEGFKLHISTRPEYREQVIRITAEICIDLGVAFKVLASFDLWDLHHDKPYAAGASRWSYGKTLTLYPAPALFRGVAETLRDALRSYSGPDILTDLPVPGSKCVFYRYGAFTAAETLISPEGESIPDNRNHPFSLPPWRTDPFEGPKDTGDRNDAPPDTNPLSRYNIHTAIQHSATGGVYEAERGGHRVVIKEAREDTCVDSRGHDTPQRLHHEFDMLTRLAVLNCRFTPKPLEKFCVWRNLYVVMAYLEGEPISTFLKKAQPERLHLCYLIADAVATLHEHGILWGDVSASNVLYHRKTDQVFLIDFEQSDEIDNATANNQTAGTPYFIGDGTSLKQEIYGLGLLLLTPFQDLPHALRHRVYPKKFRRIVRECLDFRPHARPTAREVADRLKEFGA